MGERQAAFKQSAEGDDSGVNLESRLREDPTQPRPRIEPDHLSRVIEEMQIDERPCIDGSRGRFSIRPEKAVRRAMQERKSTS